jgi:hypothetical protein
VKKWEDCALGEIIAVLSGKGGTGKTSVCAAICTALAREGQRVLAIDCDVGLQNLDISLGMANECALSFADVCEGGYELRQAAVHPVFSKLSFLTAPVNRSAEEVDEQLFGEMLHKADDLFIYGEVLQGGNAREDAYGAMFPVTASSYGSVLRSAVKNNKFSAKGLEDWRHPAAPKNIVTWIESHDTYANHGESAALTHAQLRAGWALITARAGGTPLFFSRPQGPEATQFPGVSKIGDIGNNEFKHPEVVAVNKFRTAMVGQDETLINGENTGVLIVKRGDKGAVIINVNQGGKSKVSFELNLPDGTYKDKANKLKYTVKDGVVNITVPRKKIAVIY